MNLDELKQKAREAQELAEKAAPGKWEAGGIDYLSEDELQPWDVGITNVFVADPIKGDGRPPLGKDQR